MTVTIEAGQFGAKEGECLFSKSKLLVVRLFGQVHIFKNIDDALEFIKWHYEKFGFD